MGQIIKRPKAFGKVIISLNTNLVSVETLGCEEIYSIDSDFMVRTWDLKNDGKCIQSTILKQCPRAMKLISKADDFRQGQIAYQTSDYDQQLKRKLDCFDISPRVKGNTKPSIVAVCDELGILHVNNFNSGNLLLSLTTKESKGTLSKIYFVPHWSGYTKLFLITAYTDGKIRFYMEPNIHLEKDNQPDNFC